MKIETTENKYAQDRNEVIYHYNFSSTIVRTKKGYTFRSVATKMYVPDGSRVRLWNDTTGEQIMLSDFVAGKRFAEFEAEKIFGTDKPSAPALVSWLKTLRGKSEYWYAMQWVKQTVPLDVLLGITAWHWSQGMLSTWNPFYFATLREYRRYYRLVHGSGVL